MQYSEWHIKCIIFGNNNNTTAMEHILRLCFNLEMLNILMRIYQKCGMILRNFHDFSDFK